MERDGRVIMVKEWELNRPRLEIEVRTDRRRRTSSYNGEADA